MIHIERGPWREMINHAQAAYPNECCGAMIGAIDGDNKTVTFALALDNVSAGSQAARCPNRRRDFYSMRHTVSVLVENKFGVLTRVAGLFSGRGYNIDTLNVAPTQQPNTSRMTIVTVGDDATLDQIVKQLNKLVNVLDVVDFRESEFIDRELVLVRVTVNTKTRAEIMQMTDIFRAKIVDVQPKSLTIEITGDESKIDKFLRLMNTFGVLELTRTGKIALARK